MNGIPISETRKTAWLLSTFRIYDTKIVAYDNVERDLLLLILTGDLPLSMEWLTRKTIISLIRLQL